jgi:murein DD-endopeptidase MepM/ murein hydrolase activator NlpD
MKKFGLVFLLFLIVPLAQAADFGVSSYNPRQGDTVVVYFSGAKPQSVVFDGQPISIFNYKNYGIGVIPIAATKKAGAYSLEIIFSGNNAVEKQIKVKAGKFPLVVLGIPEKLDMTPAALVSNLQISNKDIKSVTGTKSEDITLSQAFGLPLYNNKKLGSLFGEIRQTGDQQIRHMGIDLSAKLGAAVASINKGIVRKAYFDEIYGNSVIVDHGHGIFSTYLHLDSIKVKENDAVKKGTVIGTVGQTGYAIGPHLHLSIKVNDVSVDPLRFVSAFK